MAMDSIETPRTRTVSRTVFLKTLETALNDCIGDMGGGVN
jgi:hypothetical protein